MKFKRIPSAAAVLGVLAVLSGCASHVQQLHKSEPHVNTAALQSSVPEGVHTATVHDVQDEKWWLLLEDRGVSEVIERALKNNTDVRLAVERLNEVAAVLGYTGSARHPSFFGQLTENRNRSSRATSSPNGGVLSESTTLGLGVSWELDLWGKLAAQEDAARANFMQQGYNVRGVRLSVAATAASLCNQVRVLDLQVKVLEQTLGSREEAYALAKKRYEVGLTNELQLRQTESEHWAVRAQLPDTREQLSKAKNALSALIGGELPAFDPLEVVNLQPAKLFVVPDSVPSELLLRRPDLAASEQQLLAAEANLEVARKAFFPSIELSAFGGRESSALSNLFSGPAKLWNFQAQLTQPIFQANRLVYERDATLARHNQSVVQYEASIRTAFQEVYDAIVAQREARERLMARQEQVTTLTEVVRLARLRLEHGVASQLEVLDAQRSLLSAQLNWVGAWQQQQEATLSMFRALGGGFQAKG